MSTLSVSNIQNSSSPQTNIVLNTDGTSKISVVGGITAPAVYQVGTLWFDTGSNTLKTWDGTTWAAAGATIPWTAKGQLVVGTGVGTDTLLNVGTDTGFLVADAAATSGLKWSDASTSAAQLPAGTSGQYPATPTQGQIRYNTTNNYFEGYQSGSWIRLGQGAVGGGSDQVFYLNDQVVTTNYTVPVGKNAVTGGTITVSPSATVIVSAGSTWTVV
jgi:hypothetical protein